MEGLAPVGDREKEIISNLLEVYKTFRLLWDPSSPQYFNKDARNQALEHLLEIFKELKPQATLKEVRKKLENMRSSFRKELKKVKDSHGTGSGANEEFVPKLWYFESMRFLDENSVTRAGRDTMEDTDSESTLQPNDNVVYEEDEDNPQDITNGHPVNSPEIQNLSTYSNDPSLELRPPPVAPKRAKMTFRKKQEQLLDIANAMLTKQESEVEVFGQCIAKQLMSLEPFQRTIAEKLFSETIFHGKLGQLTTTSSISLESSPFPHLPLTQISSLSSATSGSKSTPYSTCSSYPPSPASTTAELREFLILQ